jgi:hypothetical protein
LGGHSEGVETLLGRFKRGRFVKAPFQIMEPALVERCESGLFICHPDLA